MPGNGQGPGQTERLASSSVPEPALAPPPPRPLRMVDLGDPRCGLRRMARPHLPRCGTPLVGGAGGRRVAHRVARVPAARGHPRLSDPLRPGERGARLAAGRTRMPYAIYRETHTEHHEAAHLTDPGTDPESFYLSAEDWTRMGRPRRAVHLVNQTLAGRPFFGPASSPAGSGLKRRAVCSAVTSRTPARGRNTWWEWRSCSPGRGVCEMSIAAYVALFAWPGLSLTLLRSFAEHEPAAKEDRRTVIVESGLFGSLLYLNNNLHAVHHAFPGPFLGTRFPPPGAPTETGSTVRRDRGCTGATRRSPAAGC